MVLNRGPLDWESSTLTTGPLGRKKGVSKVNPCVVCGGLVGCNSILFDE